MDQGHQPPQYVTLSQRGDKDKVAAKFVFVKVFTVPLTSDPNSAPGLPNDASIVPSLAKSLNLWTEKTIQGMWILNTREIVNNRERDLKLCLVHFVAKPAKNPESRGFFCEQIKCQLGFVDLSYLGYTPWIDFQNQFGPADYWIKTGAQWTHQIEGYKGTIDLIKEAPTTKDKLDVIRNNYPEKQALIYTGQILSNANTFEKAQSVLQQKPEDNQRCNSHCKLHEDLWKEEKRIMEQKYDREIGTMKEELAKLKNTEENLKKHIKEVVCKCIREYVAEGVMSPIRKFKLIEEDKETFPLRFVQNQSVSTKKATEFEMMLKLGPE